MTWDTKVGGRGCQNRRNCQEWTTSNLPSPGAPIMSSIPKRDTANDSREEKVAIALNRRTFLAGATAGAVTLAMPRWTNASESGLGLGATTAFQDDLSTIR